MKIILSGGGTMGSVSPLVAVYEKIKKTRPDVEFLFVGTDSGPEKKAVESYKIPFRAIASGKLRRYFSWRNFFDPFLIVIGFFQSFFIILKYKPDAIMVAGSFVGVPLVWAAWILRAPVVIHQQDIVAGFANKLMANFATRITVSFEPSLKDFSREKTVLTGNPVREEFFSCDQAKGREVFDLKENLPTVLIVGGGTGSQKINEVVEQSLAELLQFCQVIHIVGHGKKINVTAENYFQFEFLTHEMTDALCAADLVISRGGMSTLCELAILAKPTIVIPIPGHQDENARHFQKNNAAVVLSQESLSRERFVAAIKELIFGAGERQNLSRNMTKIMNVNAALSAAETLLSLAEK